MDKLGKLIQVATSPVRQYQKKAKQKARKPDFARFKAKVWFKDGNAAPFYSYDWQEYTLKDRTKVKQYSELIAFKKLIQMIYKWFELDKVVSFEIYIDITDSTCTDWTKPEAANYQFVVARGNVQSMRNHPLLRFTEDEKPKVIYSVLKDQADLKQLENAASTPIFSGAQINYLNE